MSVRMKAPEGAEGASVKVAGQKMKVVDGHLDPVPFADARVLESHGYVVVGPAQNELKTEEVVVAPASTADTQPAIDAAGEKATTDGAPADVVKPVAKARTTKAQK